MLSSGFTGASVSKFLLFGVISSSILASITDVKYLFYIEIVPHLWPYRQIWRLLSWQACYTNSTELLFASMTFYHMRVIERLWGSRKFASFLLTITPLTCLLPPLLLAGMFRPLSLGTINHLPAGPTPLVFALLAQYHAVIPHVYKYRIASGSSALSPNRESQAATPSDSHTSSDPAGLLFSDKTTTYILAAQLAFSQFPGSLLAAAVGWGIGIAWRNYILPDKMIGWRVPGWVFGEKTEGREGFEGLRRRLEGEGRASGVEGAEDGARRRAGERGMAQGVVDQFRGMF
ncbi:MAG: hypothetical protein LQ340_006591 [Diploschistes diacapsis]|nr:MAG: hypothetical protein LQ340_006591 [Diploschistes diacapsis]